MRCAGLQQALCTHVEGVLREPLDHSVIQQPAAAWRFTELSEDVDACAAGEQLEQASPASRELLRPALMPLFRRQEACNSQVLAVFWAVSCPL